MAGASILDVALAAPDNRWFLTHWRGDICVERLQHDEFWQMVRDYAAWMQRQGIEAGAVVALIMPHGATLMAAFAGALWLGAVPTILAYPTFKVDPEKYRKGLSGMTQNLDIAFILVSAELPAEFRTELTDAARTRLCTIAAGPPATTGQSPPRCAVDPSSVAFLQHSSGTTGIQKAVAITHQQALHHLQLLTDRIGIAQNDIMYSWLPLYHDMGLITAFLLPLVTNMPIVTQAATDWVLQPLRMLELMAEWRCTLAFLPNFAFQFLADRLERRPNADLDLSCIRAIVNASEPVRATNMAALERAAGPYGLRSHALHTLYGMAENVIGITLSDVAGGTPPRRLPVDPTMLQRGCRVIVDHCAAGASELVSCGRCLPGTTVDVVDEQGNDLPDGVVGELVIRSGTLFSGYYRQPELTATTLREGRFWSGDLGFRLDGEVYVTGRRKDLIIIGGRNIFPEDVEAVVNAHPKIHRGRSLAFGIYNERVGTEELVIVAELSDGAQIPDPTVIEQELRRAVAANLDIAVTRVFLFHARWIIKSTAGKLARAETREKLLREYPELANGGRA